MIIGSNIAINISRSVKSKKSDSNHRHKNCSHGINISRKITWL